LGRDRWWGGTRLTNDRLWRWGPILTPQKGDGMKRLIFTTSDSGAGCLRQPGIADAVMPLGSRFFRGKPLPSDVEIANSLEEDDWLGRIYRK
jgi:hypothetical protein